MGADNKMSPAALAMQAMVDAFAAASGIKSISGAFAELFMDRESGFLKQVEALDAMLERNSEFAGLAEVLFDMLMVQFLASETHREDFFDTTEWLHIEDETIDRGSELLNLMLYITEANETEAEINLDDFLNEFLLVDTDEFQDEYRIYEPLVENEDLEEMEIPALREIQVQMKDDAPLKNFFEIFVFHQ